MPSEFITMIFVFVVTMLLMLLIVSGIDTSFVLSQAKDYGLIFQLNTLFVVFSLIFTAIVIFIGSLLDDVLGKVNFTLQRVLFLIILTIVVFTFKYYLYVYNDLFYRSYILIAIVDLFLLTVPFYIVYKMLKAFGKAFRH